MTPREQLEALKRPLNPSEIEWRVSRAMNTSSGPRATVLAYKTARADMNRLDEVFGPENWQTTYTHTPEGFLCELRVRFAGTDEWICRSDGSAETQVEGFKGGISGALKRAASALGIGRYLYDLPETWVKIVDSKNGLKNPNYINDKKNQIKGYWETPALPAWALPQELTTLSMGSAAGTKPEALHGKQLSNYLTKYAPELSAEEMRLVVRVIQEKREEYAASMAAAQTNVAAPQNG